MSSFLSIAVFSCKGGVGKTTLAVQLAAEFSSCYKTVLVDADYQCNTTAFFFDNDDDDEEEEEEKQQKPDASALNNTFNFIPYTCRNIKASKVETFAGHTLTDPPLNKFLYLWYAAEYDKAEAVFNNLDHYYKVPEAGGLLLVVNGTAQLQDYESDACKSLEKDSKGLGAFLFRSLIQSAKKTVEAEVVLFDLSAGNSAINQTIMASVDFILVPCESGIYSCQAVQQFHEKILPKVQMVRQSGNTGLQRYMEMTGNEKYSAYKFTKGIPRVLPPLLNKFQTAGRKTDILSLNSSDAYLSINNYVLRSDMFWREDEKFGPVGCIPLLKQTKAIGECEAIGVPAFHVTREQYENYFFKQGGKQSVKKTLTKANQDDSDRFMNEVKYIHNQIYALKRLLIRKDKKEKETNGFNLLLLEVLLFIIYYYYYCYCYYCYYYYYSYYFIFLAISPF